MTGQIIDIRAEVRELGKTGKAEILALPETLAEKLLVILDEQFDGDVDKCLSALAKVIFTAQEQGEPALSAVDEWAESKMDEMHLENVCEQFL